MSNELNKHARYARLKGKQKTVLFVLCDMADNESFRAWPSIKKLALYCGISERTVVRAIANLEQLGVLRKEKRKSSKNQFFSNIYTIDKFILKQLSTGYCHSDGRGTVTLAYKTPPIETSFKKEAKNDLVGESFNGRKIFKKTIEEICRENGWSFKS